MLLSARHASRTHVLTALVLGGLVGSAASVAANDWPQWRGADRRSEWHETGIVERLPTEGLKVTWRVPVHTGFAGPAVAGGRVFVLDWEDDRSRGRWTAASV